MKKLLRYGDCFVLLAAILGCLLRLWFQNSGIDNKGLHQASHPAWVLLCILSAGTVVFVWFLTRAAGNNQRYEDNFRRSLVGTGTYILMAIFLGYTGITGLLDANDFPEKLASVLCMMSAVTLAVTGIERYSGNRPAIFLHLVPCVYFALRLFLVGRDLGTEPEVCTFLFRFLAALSIVPAFFCLWAFDMNMGNRRHSLFWSLTTAFFCLITTFESTENWMLYMVFAAFLLSNICQLKYLAAPEPETAKAEEIVAQEAPLEEEAPFEKPAPFEDFAPFEEPAPFEDFAPFEEPTPFEDSAPFDERSSFEEETTIEEDAPAQEEEDLRFIVPQPPAKPKAVLHADINPEVDMDAFLADIRLFLDSDNES